MDTGNISRRVELRHDGRSIYFRGDVPPEVREQMMTSRRVYNGGVQLQRESLVGSEARTADLGLVETVVNLLTTRGIEVQLAASLLPPPLNPQMDSRRVREFRDRAVIELVNTAREGLISYSPGVSPMLLVLQIADAFPEKRMVIICASANAVEALTTQLRSYELKVTQVVRRQIGEHEHVAKIVVTTPWGAEDGAVELQQADIVLFDDASHALHEQAEYELSKSDSRFRLFGLIPHALQIAPYDRDRLTRVFGFRRVHVPRHGHQETDIRVAFLPIWGPGLPQDLSVLELKRKGIFRNHLRHRLIAQVARQFVGGDPAVSNRLLHFSPDALRLSERKAVVIVVENVDHAESLRNNLRGWSVWSDRREKRVANNPGISLSWYGQVAAPDVTNLICTVDGLATAPLYATDIVIWAASGSRGPKIPASRLIMPYGAERPLLVVDVTDTQHPQLVAWNDHRQRDYLAREWIPLGYDRTDFRILQFQRSRG